MHEADFVVQLEEDVHVFVGRTLAQHVGQDHIGFFAHAQDFQHVAKPLTPGKKS